MNEEEINIEEIRSELAVLGSKVAMAMRYYNKKSATIITPGGAATYKIFIQEVDNDEVTGVNIE